MFKRLMTKRNIVFLAVAVIALLFFYFIVPISIPLIVALILALMIKPFVKLLEQKVKSRKWSVTIVYTSILSFILLCMYLFLTKLIQHIIQFSKDLPDKMNNILNAWTIFEARLAKMIPESVSNALFDETQKFLFNLRDAILDYFNAERITNLVASLPETFISGLVFLVALFLFMLEIPNMHTFVRKHTYDKTYEKAMYIWKRVSSSVFGMLRAAFILSGITWLFTFIAPKNALVLSFIICLVDLLPILGATGVTIPWALYAYITGDPSLAVKLILLSVFLLVQRKVLEPKVMGKGVGLSPLPTLIAMFIGLKLMGFIGFFIGPIVLIIILIILESGAFHLNFKV